MSRGDELVLSALKKELILLSKKAAKAKAEYDEYMSTGSEAIAIHEEFAKIVKAKEHGQKIIDRLEALQKRDARVQRIRKKDLLKLMDKQHDTKLNRDALASEISTMEWRLNRCQS